MAVENYKTTKAGHLCVRDQRSDIMSARISSVIINAEE